MDRTTVKAVNDLAHMGLPETTEALLLAAFDTADPAADLAAVGALCEAAGATQVVPAEDAAESELLLQARRLSLTALEAVKGTTMIDDVCVPRSRLAEMLEGVERIAEKYELTIGVCAHAGDGNTHPTVCFDAADPDESRRARESFDEIMALGLELGGTITGEHGVGRPEEGVAGARDRPGGGGDAAGRQGRSSTRWASSIRASCSDGPVRRHSRPWTRPTATGRAATVVGRRGASSSARPSSIPSCSASEPGGTTRSVRSSQADTWAAGASSRASPSGELSAIRTTLRPSTFVGHTRTSPCPHGRNTPSTSSSRANVQFTGCSEPMWKVTWTAYGSSVR